VEFLFRMWMKLFRSWIFKRGTSPMTRFPGLRRKLWRWFYTWLGKEGSDEMKFMNYGFAACGETGPVLELAADDERYRYHIQLYHYLATTVDVSGKRVLEIGSGRGGGCDYIARYLHPESMVGVDISESNVAFCRRTYQAENLRFEVGDAESLPLQDASFDVVLNLESSHCYGSVEKFLREVKRVLKPGGHFCWADLRFKEDVEKLRPAFEQSGLEDVGRRDISKNVLQALDLGHNSKKASIDELKLPPFWDKFFQDLTGVRGSQLYSDVASGNSLYLSATFRKP